MASEQDNQTIELLAADDFHIHLRDEPLLADLVPAAASQFSRVIVMPNLKPPVTTTELALAYRDRILAALPAGAQFTPLMTLYLTDSTPVEEIARAKASGHVYAVKLYPAGATTNSHSGVTDIQKVYPVLQAMADVGMPLLVHGEVTDSEVDIFDREATFIERYMRPLVAAFPTLKIVMEHITTREAVDFVSSSPANVGATITAHHLLYSRNAIFAGGINPHMYCLPVLKRELHRQALVKAATSGSPKFFAGTDSAPHPRHTKECDHGCAGTYTAFAALPLYAETFDSEGALDRLEAFTSRHGAHFYGLPPNTRRVRLVQREQKVPDTLPLGVHAVVPLRAGETIAWSGPEWLD